MGRLVPRSPPANPPGSRVRDSGLPADGGHHLRRDRPHPVSGDTPADTAISILSDEPDLEGLTGPLRDLVERALAKDPAARPTARELFDLLLNSAPTKAQPPAEEKTTAETGPTMRVAAPSRKRRMALVAGVCSLLLVAAVGWTVGGSFWTGSGGCGAEPVRVTEPCAER